MSRRRVVMRKDLSHGQATPPQQTPAMLTPARLTMVLHQRGTTCFNVDDQKEKYSNKDASPNPLVGNKTARKIGCCVHGAKAPALSSEIPSITRPICSAASAFP